MANWSEIDFAKELRNIPAEHFKTRQEFRVPLQPQAIKLLKSLPRIVGCEKIFPGATGKALSDMALSQLMRGMRERGELNVDAVPHGFRSTFRDWAAEQTRYPDEIRKAASGHAISDAVKASYERTDLLDRRRSLMNEWANFIDQPSSTKVSNVTPIRKKE
jgi:integrase